MMHIKARRVFRLAFVPALALAVAYALQMPLPFLAPLFAFVLTIKPGPPLGFKNTTGLVILVLITLGLGVLLIPLLLHFQLVAILLVLLGIYFSSYLTVNLQKTLPGMFIAMGLTLVSAAGTLSSALAISVIQGLISGIIISAICQSLVYLFFPEDKPSQQASAEKTTAEPQDSESITTSSWIAIRSALIVMPAYFLVLTNPGMYMPIMMKSVLLSQQSSTLDARNAAREMLGSTFSGGIFAVLFWIVLGILPNLWLFFLWMLLFSMYFSSKIYGIISSRFSASFWLNTAITMLILIGPAVEDTNTGKDVYAAFFVRMSLFVGVTLYALAAVYLLELLKTHKRKVSHVN